MEIIYIDELFLLNLAADYLLCLAAARVCGLALKRLRYFAAALFGAAYSVFAVLPACAFLVHPLCKLASAGFMGLIAYGGEARLLRCLAVFLAVSAAFGGAVWAANLSSGVSLDLRVLLLSFALCYIGLTLISGCRARFVRTRIVSVRLRFLGRACLFSALSDSGNCLCDPLSGSDVLIASPAALASLFAENAALLSISDPVALLEAASACPALKGRFRLIPYSALGGAGLLPAFRPDGVWVDEKPRSALMVAVSDRASGDGFQAIVRPR